MDWRISRALTERLLAEAAASRDAEVCGLLFGGDGMVDDALACRNVADCPYTRFEIDPVALIAAHKAERAGGPVMIGCYHSHPNGGHVPSVTDSAAGFAGLWIIIAGKALHGWEGDAAGRFTPAKLVAS